MKTYTEDEIKKWFEIMKKKYHNSKLLESLESVEFKMFNKTFSDEDCLEKIKKST